MNSPQRLKAYDVQRHGWQAADARDLLWRSVFGASPQQVARATERGLLASVDSLFAADPESEQFTQTADLLWQNALDTTNIGNMKAWWLYRMTHSANPLAEKMALFWHNHFATSYSKVLSVEHMANQHMLIRKHALGNFRELLHGMSADVAMLLWLDGNANKKRHPNENFAREVMELFSLGVGNYTERDISEAARAFTGWFVRNDEFWFNAIQHDPGEKTLFGKSGTFGGRDVVELCLEHQACPRFLAMKLLKTFVVQDPQPHDIEALAGTIRHHDFEMRPVLRDLFLSEMFFARQHRSVLIKSPTEFVIGSFRSLSVRPNLEPTIRALATLGQDVFQPPTVKGWEGGRLWISSATMLQRARFTSELVYNSRVGELEDAAIEAALTLSEQDDPVRFWGESLLSLPEQSAHWQTLRDFYERSDSGKPSRDRRLIHLIMTLPEFQLT